MDSNAQWHLNQRQYLSNFILRELATHPGILRCNLASYKCYAICGIWYAAAYIYAEDLQTGQTRICGKYFLF